ncbi:MAG: hypothetical protein V4612_06145, partial [Pseudomonadota bacterium]
LKKSSLLSMKNLKFLKQNINQILATLILFAVFSVLGCSSNKTENYYDELKSYEQTIKSYDCLKLIDERNYINQNLNSLNKQINNSSFDIFMEAIVSIGIYSFSGKNSLQKNKDIFDQKLEIVANIQKTKSCPTNL